jgi:hypothetical protein
MQRKAQFSSEANFTPIYTSKSSNCLVRESDKEEATWKQSESWPLNSLDHIKDISGDQNVNDKVYFEI